MPDQARTGKQRKAVWCLWVLHSAGSAADQPLRTAQPLDHTPFSCKRRGFCLSYGARRMAQTAAHPVDRVIPQVPVRQWVLSLPIPLRLLLAAQPKLVTPVLQVLCPTGC